MRTELLYVALLVHSCVVPLGHKKNGAIYESHGRNGAAVAYCEQDDVLKTLSCQGRAVRWNLTPPHIETDQWQTRERIMEVPWR